jgi:hypothetical protein
MNRKPTRGGVKTAMFSRNQCQWETFIFPGSTGNITLIFYGETGNISIIFPLEKLTKPKVKICFDRNLRFKAM